MTEKEFLEQFEKLNLPADKFNHRGHLWLGWLYIRDFHLGEASQKLNQGIKLFAQSLGAAGKFNMTLTTTFACAIKSRYVPGQSFDDFLKSNRDLEKNPMAIIETHYSPELLFTDEAKKNLIPPDREPFPPEFEEELKKTVGFTQKQN